MGHRVLYCMRAESDCTQPCIRLTGSQSRCGQGGHTKWGRGSPQRAGFQDEYKPIGPSSWRFPNDAEQISSGQPVVVLYTP
eukprot:349585-Chlamydomonas_euryale.AAC.5